MPHLLPPLAKGSWGGRLLKPREVSLARQGVLFLDEAPEFGMSLLKRCVNRWRTNGFPVARAGCTVRYPACLQLVLAFNPFPCVNLGRGSHVCVCNITEIHRYWRRVGGALLDRIVVRVPLKLVPAKEMRSPPDRQECAAAQERAARGRLPEGAAYQALFTHIGGDSERARTIAKECLEVARSAGDVVRFAAAFSLIGLIEADGATTRAPSPW